MKALFSTGRLLATPGALAALDEIGRPEALPALLGRHVLGDWGDLDPEDWGANTAALRDGERLFSAYQVTPDLKLWVITERDRSATTVLLPSEY